MSNSEIVVRGEEARPSTALNFPAGTRPLVLFPVEGARLLTDFAGSDEPVTLVVPDGNWRQASKVYKRVPGLRDLPCVTLPRSTRSTYRLRAEAIARALGILDGAGAQRALESVFDAMVERTLWARGTVNSSSVESGIPEGVKRHDPTSGTRARTAKAIAARRGASLAKPSP